MRRAECQTQLSAFHTPPSALRLRAAITLTEVLISMGILTLGLLGAAALFPVGGYYMQKAVIADNGSAIAQAVMSDIVARGIVSPKAWLTLVPTPTSPNPASSNASVSTIDGRYVAYQPGFFTRPFSEALSHSLKLNNNSTIISRQFGNAYVIDPLYVAAATTTIPLKANTNTAAYAFPAAAIRNFPRSNSWTYYKSSGWNPWRAALASLAPASNANDSAWPIRRVSLQGPNGGWMDSTTADYYFRGNDDLASDLPSRDDRPARQNWEAADLVGNDGVADTPLNRQWTGDYSWIVSVVPTTTAARDALARNPEGHSYEVSVVVFYKRPLPTRISASDTDIINDAASFERTVSASVVSTGLNGGELLLQTMTENIPGNPYDNLRKGEWIMLCGPHPNSNADMSATPPQGEPRFFMNWYQVLSIETEGWSSNQRLIAVRGPEWPWQPIGDPVYDKTTLPNDLCVGICRGAVAVHTKTMRLESSRGDGMAIVSPTTGETSRGVETH